MPEKPKPKPPKPTPPKPRPPFSGRGKAMVEKVEYYPNDASSGLWAGTPKAKNPFAPVQYVEGNNGSNSSNAFDKAYKRMTSPEGVAGQKAYGEGIMKGKAKVAAVTKAKAKIIAKPTPEAPRTKGGPVPSKSSTPIKVAGGGSTMEKPKVLPKPSYGNMAKPKKK